MGYLKMQGGEWLVTGRCSSPKFRRVGKNHTPFCTVGIAAGTNPKELDEQGRPKPIWINITAWRGAAELLATAHSGDAVMVTGAPYTNEYEGRTYKGVNASVVLLSQAGLPDGNSAAPSQPPAMAELEEEDGELPF